MNYDQMSDPVKILVWIFVLIIAGLGVLLLYSFYDLMYALPKRQERERQELEKRYRI
jgi:hypothetical protein